MPHEFHVSDWLPFPIDLSHDEVLICTQLNAHGFCFVLFKNLIQIAMKPWILASLSCEPAVGISCVMDKEKAQGSFTSAQNGHRKPLNTIKLNEFINLYLNS